MNLYPTVVSYSFIQLSVLFFPPLHLLVVVLRLCVVLVLNRGVILVIVLWLGVIAVVGRSARISWVDLVHGYPVGVDLVPLVCLMC